MNKKNQNVAYFNALQLEIRIIIIKMKNKQEEKEISQIIKLKKFYKKMYKDKNYYSNIFLQLEIKNYVQLVTNKIINNKIDNEENLN